MSTEEDYVLYYKDSIPKIVLKKELEGFLRGIKGIVYVSESNSGIKTASTEYGLFLYNLGEGWNVLPREELNELKEKIPEKNISWFNKAKIYS